MAVTGRTVNRYPIGFEVLTKGINVTHPVGQMAVSYTHLTLPTSDLV